MKETINHDIIRMIKRLSNFNGSAEVEWAYNDFRADMKDILIKYNGEELKKALDDEFALQLGKNICKSICELKK